MEGSRTAARRDEASADDTPVTPRRDADSRRQRAAPNLTADLARLTLLHDAVQVHERQRLLLASARAGLGRSTPYYQALSVSIAAQNTQLMRASRARAALIRRLVASKRINGIEIARHLGVTKVAIYRIISPEKYPRP